MNIDLHIHTNASDGTLTPTQVVREASKAGLSVIAIADHDTTDGIPEALGVQEENRVEVVPAVEISATHPLGEVHILGYWMDYEHPDFRAFLYRPRSCRPNRIADMCRKLTDLGLPVSPEEVFAAAGSQASVGRPHLARVMLNKGYIRSMDEAFYRYLARGGPAYVERFKNTTSETIEIIHRCGGISVIAHPGLLSNPQIIDILIEQGARGIEAYCHEHKGKSARRFLDLARRHGLLVTGGSDYHGEMLGKRFGLGELRVPYECYEKLKAARAG